MSNYLNNLYNYTYQNTSKYTNDYLIKVKVTDYCDLYVTIHKQDLYDLINATGENKKDEKNEDDLCSIYYKTLCGNLTIQLVKEESTVEMLKQEIRKEKKLNKTLINMFIDTTDEKSEDELCIICMDNHRNCIPYPCNHFKFCKTCLEKCKNECPYCRAKFEKILDIY